MSGLSPSEMETGRYSLPPAERHVTQLWEPIAANCGGHCEPEQL
jgi:hypothetical protein